VKGQNTSDKGDKRLRKRNGAYATLSIPDRITAGCAEKAHRLRHAKDQSIGSDGMADRDFLDEGNSGNQFRKIIPGQVMTGIYTKSQMVRCFGSRFQNVQFTVSSFRCQLRPERTRIELHPVRPHF
jgi:hypothetical protein